MKYIVKRRQIDFMRTRSINPNHESQVRVSIDLDYEDFAKFLIGKLTLEVQS